MDKKLIVILLNRYKNKQNFSFLNILKDEKVFKCLSISKSYGKPYFIIRQQMYILKAEKHF